MPTHTTVSPLSLGPDIGPRVGRGSAIAHHGEILQGVFQEPGGRLRRGLVSLRCGLFGSEATFEPASNGAVHVGPPWKIKARQAVQLTLASLDAADMGGYLHIRSNIAPGWGLGSSTSDVTAAIRAVARALNVKLSREVIAKLAVKSEIASDPIMYGDRAVLFAHREGMVIEDLGGALPPLRVVGCNTDPTGAGINTLRYAPARYTWWEIEAFRPLLGLLRQAVHTQNARLVGQVASASARLNQQFLPKPRFDRLEQLAETVGALGLQVAHSGTVIGWLFDPADLCVQERIQETQARLAEMGFDPVWEFCTQHEELVTRWESVGLNETSPRRSSFLASSG